MSSTPGVRPPKQARSRETFERILLAAQHLIEEGGVEATTIQRLVERAGIGAGSFYARFDGIEALLGYLYERYWEESAAEWRAFLSPVRWESASVETVVGGFLSILMRWTGKNAAFQRALLIHALARPDYAVLVRTAELDNTIADRLGDLLADRAEVTHADPETGIRLMTLQAFATLRSRLIFMLPGGEDGISDDVLVKEMTRSALAQLGVQVPESAEPDAHHGAHLKGVPGDGIA